MNEKPIRFGDVVRVVDRPHVVGRVRHMTESTVLIEQPCGTRYADVPTNVERVAA